MVENLSENESLYLWKDIVRYAASMALISCLNGLWISVGAYKGVLTGLLLMLFIAFWALHFALSLFRITELSRKTAK